MVRLHHGTTLKRAEAIVKNGPDPKFVEPGGSFFDPAGAFSTAPASGPFAVASPTQYARGKASLFPNEGGSAILEIDVPETLVALTNPALTLDQVLIDGDIRFKPGFGLRELLDAWPSLSKRIIALAEEGA